MAIFQGKFLKGTLGGFVFKAYKGKQIVSSRPAPGTVKQTPASKRASGTFGMTSKLNRHIRGMFQTEVNDLVDAKYTSRLTAELSASVNPCRDPVTYLFQFEKESFSNLRGFEFNVVSPVKKALNVLPKVILANEMIKVTFPKLKSRLNLLFPKRATHCDLILCLGLIRLRDGKRIMVPERQRLQIKKDWKIALAGDYHAEIEKDIDVYCVASRWDFPAATLQRRRQEGKISTWYTCCTEPYPNGFTFSSPAEGVWMGWYTANKNLDGYLRWAYNSWTKDPLTDSRFTTWPAGDTYQVYPGPLSSVRFEKLIEGAQDFEKIKQLKIYYTKNNLTKELNELNKALEIFEIKSLANTTADEMMRKVKPLLNR